MAESGAFAVVLEALAELLAARITKQIDIPTIGIGASAEYTYPMFEEEAEVTKKTKMTGS